MQVGGTGPAVRRAKVVLYDWQRDIAVLDVPDLDAPALSFDHRRREHTGDDAIVAGFPENGAYDVQAARIRAGIQATARTSTAAAPSAVTSTRCTPTVRQGNSGGPLLTPTGRSTGVVFAKSLDDANTGYALTADEVHSDVAAGRSAPCGRSDTQGCAL